MIVVLPLKSFIYNLIAIVCNNTFPSIMIQRRIIYHIQNGIALNQQDQSQLISYLKTHFLYQYYTPIHFKQLIPHLTVQQYLFNQELFVQGDSITRYYLLMMGRVMTTKSQKNGEDERSLLDGPSLLGQYFYTNSTKRQKTAKIISSEAIVISFEKEVLNQQLAKQQEQFRFILHEIRQFCSCSIQALEKMKIHSSIHIEKFKLNQQIVAKPRTVYLLIEGQCKISNKKKEVVVSRFDCLAVEKYFDANAIQYSYTSYSTQLILLAINYEVIQEFNQSFIQRLRFLYQTHLLTLQLKQLPRLQRQTNKQSLCNITTTNQFRHRSTHKPTKSNSLIVLNPATNLELNRFRKEFVLGFNEQEVINNSQIYQMNKKYQQPRGYFQLKSQKQNDKQPKQMQRREWAKYVNTKSEQKQKVKYEGNLKSKYIKTIKHSPTNKQQTFKLIFNKYNSLPSIGSSKTATIKLAKSSKIKQFVFDRK